MLYFKYGKLHQKNENKGKTLQKSVAKNVVKLVSTHFRKGGIPMISDHKMCERIEKLHTEYMRIKKSFYETSIQ